MRGKGEGSIFKDTRTGLWTAIIELPPRDGKRRRKTIRRKTKQAVITELGNLKDQLRKRGDLPTKGQTVEQWFTYWFTQIAAKEVRPKTLDGYRAVVFKHIIPTIGHVKLEKVTAAHVRRVHDHLTVDLGHSSTYALLAHRVMAVAFKIAVREGRIGVNPTELTNAPRKAARELDVLDLSEAVAVLNHVQNDPLGARWATALLTGARRAEAIGIEVNRVTDVLDLSWQLLRLKRTDTPGRPDVPADYEYRHLTGGLYLTRPKSSTGWRIIPLIDPLKSILERHIATMEPNEWGLLFTEFGRPIDPARDSKSWRRVLVETGIDKNVRLHDLRHTVADLLYLAGVPEDLIPEILGHSTRAMSRSYRSRGNRERLVGAMESFSALFTQLDGGRSDTPAAIDR